MATKKTFSYSGIAINYIKSEAVFLLNSLIFHQAHRVTSLTDVSGQLFLRF